MKIARFVTHVQANEERAMWWGKPVGKPKIRNGEALTLKFDLVQDESRNSRTEIQKYVMVNGVYT